MTDQSETSKLMWSSLFSKVYKGGKYFCYCNDDDDAQFIASRLNSFDANLTERSQFQRMYLAAAEENKRLRETLATIKELITAAFDRED